MIATTPYEALLEAAKSLVDSQMLATSHTASDAEIRAFVAANCAPLVAARAALAAGCRVPLRYDESFFGDHCADWQPLRNLAQTFALEFQVAARDGDIAAAGRIGVNMLDLSNAIRRDGLVPDLLVAVAVDQIAINLLRQIRARLEAADRETLIRDLERIERDQEPAADIFVRDQQWEAAVGYKNEKDDLTQQPLPETSPAVGGLTEAQHRELRQRVQAFSKMPDHARHTLFAIQDRHTVALRRMLAIDLALRCWHAANGAYPDDLGALAFTFLSRVPDDPFTQKPFCYRRFADSFVLFSPGPTGISHDGTFGPWPKVQAGVADLCLDSFDCDCEVLGN
jgi:hypothetical protein